MTADELDERLEAALSARTLSELAVLTADLPAVTTAANGTAAEVKDVVRIEQVFSARSSGRAGGCCRGGWNSR
ncbi:DUF1707 SHOCT-like domain-containing protein (plasmid) [Streptomyces sp. HUAS TT11]|uniref:DUF1707 SHOCT-like domain-containing protein n=1 Tax=Streptomyces sp. HUAS TT11 TaxID=3447508 RepID=UPI003F656A59